MILIDTSVWSLALRRRPRDLSPVEQRLVYTWHELIVKGEGVLIGPIRQELLSGLTSKATYQTLKAQLDYQLDLPLTPDVWNLAAEFYNSCRSHGIAADDIDMTICAAAQTHATPIFTTDPDFPRYAKKLPIALHKI